MYLCLTCSVLRLPGQTNQPTAHLAAWALPVPRFRHNQIDLNKFQQVIPTLNISPGWYQALKQNIFSECIEWIE